ncbi:MAG: hypothetical protein ACQERZ_00775 [Fusobacteriota bacterium]
MNINNSLSGIQRNLNQFNTSSNRAANIKNRNMSKDIVDSNTSKRAVQANIEVIKSKEEITDSLLDIIV